MKLQRKILLTFIILSITINFVFLSNFLFNKRKNELTRLNQKIKSTCELLNQVNSGPLYDYDVSKIETNLKSFLEDPDIVSITLKEINGNISLKFEEPGFDVKRIIEKNTDVKFNGEKIGEIKILFSTSFLYESLKVSFRQQSLSFILITIFISLFIHFLLSRMIKPISDLTEVASDIANGNLDKTISITSKDEIGVLAKSFEKMQRSVKQKINFLKIENERRKQTLFRSRKQQAAILKIASREYHNASWDEITRLITKSTSAALDIDRTSIWTINETKQTIDCENLYSSKNKKFENGQSINIEQYPNYTKAIKSSVFIAANDAQSDLRTKEFSSEYLIPNDILSILDAPIKIKGNVIGVVCIEQTSEFHQWTADECVFAERIADQIANYIIEFERRKIVQALQDSEKRFGLLTQNLQSVMIYQLLTHKEGSRRFTYVSPNVKNICNVSAEEVLSNPEVLYSQIDSEILSEMKQLEDQAIKTFTTFEYEIKAQIPQRGTRWFQLISTPRRDINGDIIWDGVQIDITDRKRVENYRNNINRINDIILTSNNADQLFDNIINAMIEMYDSDRSWAVNGFGLEEDYYEISNLCTKPEWKVSKNIKLVHDKESKEKMYLLLNSKDAFGFFSTTEPIVLETLQKDFGVKSMLVAMVNPKIGKHWLIGIHQCSHERFWTNEEKILLKEIASKVTNKLNILLYSQELQRTQKYISNIIDSMPSMLIGVDVDDNITQWNAEAQRYTGMSQNEVLGKPLQKALPFLEDEVKDIQKSITDKERLSYTKRPRRVKNRIVYENITIYPLISNGIEGAVIRIDDVTERVNMEEMMIQSEKMLSVGGLAAGMAHEINNPLAGIIQNSQVLQNRMVTPNPANLTFCENNNLDFKQLQNYFVERKIDKLINNIISSGNRAADIVKNMLDFSRMDSEQKRKCDLSELIEQTISLASNDYDLKKKYDFRRINIVREFQKDIPTINCSPGKIQQVFLNILKNGAEAMIEKKYESDEPKFILKYYCQGNWVVMEITDNGPGIDIDKQKRIFEPFYTTKDPGAGTGLGLSISYFIVTENHKGEMSVESYPGDGTTFFIKLPIN